VFEAGIGGLLDCTNVIPPPVLSIITSVSLDHTAILGNTVEEIARQKAGIIKRGSCVILSADNSGSVMEIVRSTAEKVGAEFITPCKSQLKILSPDNTFRYRGEVYKTGMVGFHQIFNAVTSIEACNYLNENGFEIPSGNIHRAIENARVKARIQVIEGNPTVIVDGGHNPSGVDALADYLSEDNKKKYVIMGMVDSKDYIDCVKSISYLAENLFAVDGFASNCVPAEKIVEIAEGYTSAHTGTLKESFGKAVQLALENDGKVVICGSLYLASEFLNYSENIQIKN
jgi:dihydrofolate synthase/folylpolyglutamate synthase